MFRVAIWIKQLRQRRESSLFCINLCAAVSLCFRRLHL
jgi:hypothetical protein